MTTTKTQDLLDQLKSVKPEDVDKASTAVSLLVSSGLTFRMALKAKRAAKAGEWDKATYYMVAVLASQLSVRYQIAEARRRGIAT